MKRDNEFNTCLHFDLSDSLHRKAVEILENYNKKKYHQTLSAGGFTALCVLAARTTAVREYL